MNLPSFMMISFMLTVFLVLTILMCSHNQTLLTEKKTQFECGFNEISKNKSCFSTKFFLVMILFLIFDLEVAILLPSCSIQEYSKMGIMPPLIFVIMLTMAMMLEWFNGIIEWSK